MVQMNRKRRSLFRDALVRGVGAGRMELRDMLGNLRDIKVGRRYLGVIRASSGF